MGQISEQMKVAGPDDPHLLAAKAGSVRSDARARGTHRRGSAGAGRGHRHRREQRSERREFRGLSRLGGHRRHGKVHLEVPNLRAAEKETQRERRPKHHSTRARKALLFLFFFAP